MFCWREFTVGALLAAIVLVAAALAALTLHKIIL